MTEVGPNRQQCLGRSSRTTRRANHFVAINLQLWHVYPLSQNILLPDSRKSFLQALPSWPTEGRCATSSTRGGMRWTPAALKTISACWRTAKSCGPDTPTLGVKSAEDDSAGDGSKRARSPGRARRKPLKPLRGECRMFSGVTVVTTLACLFYFTCEAAGASSTRHSLRPPNRGLKEISDKPRAHRAARRRGCVSTSLRGANATKQSILVAPWIASRSLSSGRASARPVGSQ